jgi:hypothetical protein
MLLSTYANSYRSFTNKNGQQIDAKIVSVDKASGMVTLERTNKQKATVPIDIFSEADQSFINSYTEPVSAKEVETPEAAPVKLPKDQVKGIAEQYADGWNDRDFEKISNLFLTPRKVSESEYKKIAQTLDKVRRDNIYESAFTIKVEELGKTDPWGKFASGAVYSSWCFLTSDGKIKYDTILYKHPVAEAITVVGRVTSSQYSTGKSSIEDQEYQKLYIEHMEAIGAPLYGFKVGASKKALENSLEETIEWLEDNGGTIDTSEPKVFLPEKYFKAEQDKLKEYAKRI